MKISGIIVAAGSGKRMGKLLPKQFITIAGRSIVSYTIENVSKCINLIELILVIPEGYDTNKLPKDIQNKVDVPVKIIQGGPERQFSVYNALKNVSNDADSILVHDGVRPFVSQSLLKKLINELKNCDGVFPGLSPKETIKEINKNLVIKTRDRSKLVSVQTPQIFKKEILLKAYNYAIRNNIIGTDDAYLVEKIGGKVKVIPGEEINIKITTPIDLEIAEIIIKKGIFHEFQNR
ncbi:MAG: 2-C-methyl-D-erythritol 4-phosphate cytidylyltransferase [Candidatus Marinimicrobia bacterium]|nr:2-C-methyl-D-erythritol 4-phosphate cytidylyltransferase [Candidatus Neomarinimicrobiota bacterium]